MTKHSVAELLTKVESLLRDAEIDHAWSLHEGAEARQLARTAAKVAALRYAQECLLEEVALDSFLGELAYLATLAAASMATQRNGRDGLLPHPTTGEDMCRNHGLVRRSPTRRN
jgi:hypothetical protein